MSVKQFLFCSLILFVSPGVFCDKLKLVHDRIYKTLPGAVSCFRLTNATHQIGCSGSSSNTRGVLHYNSTLEGLNELIANGPHAPYIVLLEPLQFTRDIVEILRDSSKVKGAIIRYENDTDTSGMQFISPERRCPNDGFGAEGNTCNETEPWNPDANELLFTDFGDFPVFGLRSKDFDGIVECYNDYNRDIKGGIGDYPLCSIELTADMSAVRDTPTCFRRGGLPIPLLNGIGVCDPLGDDNVWGTLFPLEEGKLNDIILLTTKIDSVSFFPLAYSFGANSEVPGIAVLLAVIKQLGELKRTGNLIGTTRPIVYTFFHGESWDYIGSSRMVYDMQHGNFPNEPDKKKKQLPLFNLTHISDYLELSHLGMLPSSSQLYVHGDKDSELIRELNSTLNLEPSTVSSLPPASLQRFLRGNIKTENPNFKGSVLASFDRQFKSRFFGSRFDDYDHLIPSNSTPDDLYESLANVSNAIASVVFGKSGALCDGECSQLQPVEPSFIEDVLNCFLVDSNCSLFRDVVINELSKTLLNFTTAPTNFFSRYITVNTRSNSETTFIFQLVAQLSANSLDNITSCKDCLKSFNKTDQTLNVTWMQTNDTGDSCLCVSSYTYKHLAESPAFKIKDYGSKDYSTWTESRWNAISARVYLITYVGQEVGILFGGAVMTLVTFLLAVQCRRKGSKIFEPEKLYTVNN